MKKLVINKNIILYNFDKFQQIWDNNLEIELITDINKDDLDIVINKLLIEVPNDLAFSILADLAERDDLPIKYLELIYNIGDKGCKMAICLRSNLPLNIVNICNNSDDIDIKQHYLLKKKR